MSGIPDDVFDEMGRAGGDVSGPSSGCTWSGLVGWNHCDNDYGVCAWCGTVLAAPVRPEVGA